MIIFHCLVFRYFWPKRLAHRLRPKDRRDDFCCVSGRRIERTEQTTQRARTEWIGSDSRANNSRNQGNRENQRSQENPVYSWSFLPQGLRSDNYGPSNVGCTCKRVRRSRFGAVCAPAQSVIKAIVGCKRLLCFPLPSLHIMSHKARFRTISTVNSHLGIQRK